PERAPSFILCLFCRPNARKGKELTWHRLPCRIAPQQGGCWTPRTTGQNKHHPPASSSATTAGRSPRCRPGPPSPEGDETIAPEPVELSSTPVADGQAPPRPPDGGTNLLAAERRARISALAARQGVVRTEELSRIFGVSPVTIRSD